MSRYFSKPSNGTIDFEAAVIEVLRYTVSHVTKKGKIRVSTDLVERYVKSSSGLLIEEVIAEPSSSYTALLLKYES